MTPEELLILARYWTDGDHSTGTSSYALAEGYLALSVKLEEKEREHAVHLEAVGDFLKELHATMIDPCSDGVTSVSEMCRLLLEKAAADRESAYEAQGLRVKLEAAEQERDGVRADKQGAYAERDRLVCVLSKFWPSHLARHPEDDTTWDDEWRWIVCLHSPVGQLTWHIKDSERPWFDHLLVLDGHWDGHTTEQKYSRLESLTASRGEVVKACPRCKTNENQSAPFIGSHCYVCGNNWLHQHVTALALSGQPCGCDPAANWTCERHSTMPLEHP